MLLPRWRFSADQFRWAGESSFGEESERKSSLLGPR